MNLLKIEGANCGNFGGCKIWQPTNFTGCEISQPANTAHTCTCYLLFDPLVGGFIQVYPYVILILEYTFVISSLLSLYKLSHACNKKHLIIQSIGQARSFLPSTVGDFIFFPLYFLAFLGCQT